MSSPSFSSSFLLLAHLYACRCVLLSLVHDMAEADVGDITPEHASGVSKEAKLALEEVRCFHSRLFSLPAKP